MEMDPVGREQITCVLRVTVDMPGGAPQGLMLLVQLTQGRQQVVRPADNYRIDREAPLAKVLLRGALAQEALLRLQGILLCVQGQPGALPLRPHRPDRSDAARD